MKALLFKSVGIIVARKHIEISLKHFFTQTAFNIREKMGRGKRGQTLKEKTGLGRDSGRFRRKTVKGKNRVYCSNVTSGTSQSSVMAAFY